MSIAASSGSDAESEDRVIDRSGDIDQRPVEERTLPASNIVRFKAAPPPPLTHFQEEGVAVARAGRDGDSRPRFSEPRLSEIASRLQKQLDEQHAKAKSQLAALTRKIEAQEKRCIPPKLDDELQQIRFQRQKILVSNGPILAGHLRDERSRLKDLELFKAQNGLTRDAYYPGSQIFAIGILFLLILAEAAINGVLFADTSDQGLFGGWMEALVLSLTNIGAAFLLGRLILTQLNRRGLFQRLAASLASLLGIGAILAINIYGAHYRDYKASPVASAQSAMQRPVSPALPAQPAEPTKSQRKSGKPNDASPPAKTDAASQSIQAESAVNGFERRGWEREAFGKVLSAPLEIQSFTSFFLLVIGLCGATVAAWDGYKLDDPFPGYGRRHRRYLEARSKKAEALQRILNQSNAIISGSAHSIARKIEDYAEEIAALQSLHHAHAAELKTLNQSLDETVQKAEDEISFHERLVLKGQPRLDECFALSVTPLPSLSEKHTKFCDTQEKKLKSIQKIALKEQNDVLSMFETASDDFQKLLSEITQVSLQATP